MNSSRQRSKSGRSILSQNKSHIVEKSLNRKSQLIDKYQSQMQDLIQQINPKQYKRSVTNISNNSNQLKSIRRNRIYSSIKNQPKQIQNQMIISGSMKDYQKLILGLQYALQAERKKVEVLTQRNNSLQTQISNLRNILVGPDQSKQYQKTILKQTQQKINQLQQKILDQKKNYEFIIESKNQAIINLQSQLITFKKTFQNKLTDNKQKFNKNEQKQKQNGMLKKIIELMLNIQELRNTVMRKNIQIQSLKYRKFDFNQPNDSDQSDNQIKKIRKIQRMKFYQQQLQTSNNMIMKKNIQILNLSNKVTKYQQVLDVVQMYLDKKQVKNINLNILQTSVITKLRILLRQKVTFEKELLTQLNDHNKKISAFQNSMSNKQSITSVKLNQVIGDNKKLSSLVTSLQINIKNLEKSLSDQKKQNQYLKNQVEINKKQFIEEIKRLKGDLGTISSVTKNQFDRMKLQNLKLTEQNRSLLFLVGEKQRQIHQKGSKIKTFQDYRQKINSLDLNISQVQKRKIQKVNQDVPQIGTKLLLINSFSTWMFQWNKIKSWSNKKVLLNLLLDKQQIRKDSLNSMNMLIDVLHQCLLHSKNIQIQQRAIILFSYFLPQGILKHSSIYLDKITPIFIRGFRQIIQGQQQQKTRILNFSTLKIFTQLQKLNYSWNQQLTNQMLSINGLKFIFKTIQDSQIDDNIEMAYNILIMITKQNQMISFMISFNITQLVLKNLNNKYQYIIFLLELLRNLLKSQDFIRPQKSFLEFRKLITILKADDDQQVINLGLECLEILMQNSTAFVKSLNKIQALSVLNSLLKSQSQYKLLKKLTSVYGLIMQNLEDQHIEKFIKNQLQKILKVTGQKNISDNRFKISLKIIYKISQQINQHNDMDQKIISTVFELYELYESLQQKTRKQLNQIIDLIYQRNKIVINKFSTDKFLTNLVEAYKSTNNTQEINLLLKILLFENQQKHTTQLLRTGRQSYIDKLINDAINNKNYLISILSLKNLLALAREKYIEKYINTKQMGKIIIKVLKERGQEEYLSLSISVIYFLSKNQTISTMAIQNQAVEKVTQVIIQKHDKQNLIFKCFALLELLNTMNYKRKVLNYFLSNDPKLQILKTFNYILKKAQNKTEMGARAVFFYDFLLGKSSIQSLTILIENNDWMIQDLISMRNQYISKVDSLVYKIQLILKAICERSKKLNKIYKKFKIQGDISSGDQQN